MTDVRSRMIGCWLGKCIGGTLGGPYEGREGPHALEFYDPVPTGMMPNDDLDLQVVWLEKLRETGGAVSPKILADAWQEHVNFHPDEYGIALRNLARKLYPPFSGAFDNPFRDGMGCAIRTEIWACLAPGDPEKAVALAEADGCVDHTGDGLDAARFLAALQSMAFAESDRERLIDAAMKFVSPAGRLAAALRDTRAAWAETGDWAETRRRIVAAHRVENWTDVCQNLAFILLGWLAGGGDFGRSLCAAVNCGGDSDCTGATLGALLGILAPDSIPAKWSAPVGRAVVLSPGIVGMHPPADIDAMTDELVALSPSVRLVGPRPAREGSLPSPRTACVADSPLCVSVVYPQSGAFVPGAEGSLCVVFGNDSGEEFAGSVRLGLPRGWKCAGAGEEELELKLAPGAEKRLELKVAPPAGMDLRPCRNLLAMELKSGELRWRLDAGLPLSVPFEIGGKATETPTHDIPLAPSGVTTLALEFVVPARDTYRIVLCAPARVRFSVDGAYACDDSSCGTVSAIHRPTGAHADVALAPGAHLLEATVGEAQGGAPALARLSIGYPSAWRLVPDVEYAPPRRRVSK